MTEIEAIADAGPLIHLDESGAAEALHHFRRITVPTPVADEVRAMPRGPGTRLLRQRHLHVTRPSRDEQAAADALPVRRLSGADRLVLAFADARDAPVLTDDLDVRDAARALGIRAIGSIGIILRAITTRLLPRAEGLAALDALLEDSSMYVTRALIEQAKAAEQAALDKRRS
ncbi:MAG: hypothetical protein AABY18_03850 [Candidatus Thermoplasmatota archaeon]